MSRPLHSVSVAAVVTDDAGRVLVIQRRDNGKWQIPGGILELDESIPTGLRREVLEETGVEIDPGRLTGVYKNVKLGVVALVFRATATGGRAAPTDEAAAVEWWTPARIEAETDEVFAIRVLDALDSHDTAVRLHNGVTLLPDGTLP
ncbi:NUDIX hydrolase [Dactylosporangium siamense]|uniref:NUDIX hydrolase n=1 Tax=Dactylosporangium siamense TaxID=685454 RepID=A0A919PLP2_9ACTN|nr:NUDIX domain-containing protein [Dactylosporangium siamense]GIG46069.1 NUDIX hydrolase [Dactylosporangium siamense]